MNTNRFEAKATREDVLALEARLFQQQDIGLFEHYDSEAGRFQWVSYDPRAEIKATECPDGSWDISYEGAISSCLVDFALFADIVTLNVIVHDDIKEIYKVITNAIMTATTEADSVRLRGFLGMLMFHSCATIHDLEAGLDSVRD